MAAEGGNKDATLASLPGHNQRTDEEPQSTVAKGGSGNGASGNSEPVEVDDFGLPLRPKPKPQRLPPSSASVSDEDSEVFHEAPEEKEAENENAVINRESQTNGVSPTTDVPSASKTEGQPESSQINVKVEEIGAPSEKIESTQSQKKLESEVSKVAQQSSGGATENHEERSSAKQRDDKRDSTTSKDNRRSQTKQALAGMSEWSHQRLADVDQLVDEEESEGEWKAMPALGELDEYDDYGRLIARGTKQEDEDAVYSELGGAGKGYTRVGLDDDVQSVTSLDDDTRYLFKETGVNSLAVDDEIRDPLSQLQATKDLLTEGQRIAYVGVVRLSIYQMTKELEDIVPTKSTKKHFRDAVDSMQKWGQGVMVRLFTHMEIDTAEQLMIEQLAEHGVTPGDLVPPLMQNSRVKNPMADDKSDSAAAPSSTPASPSLRSEPRASASADSTTPQPPHTLPSYDDDDNTPPPPYDQNKNGDEGVPDVTIPSQMTTSEKIEIDLRWTVLCDLFLVLISDSAYDSRSRCLLERVGKAMEVSWVQICRFEKRVIDALEMEQADEKEKWDEAANMESRRKAALKKKYMIMGLATVGGGLVIGLSAGLLAPVIGAGLAAGFTTIGVSGTGAFLGGAGGTALIASGATVAGTHMGLKASHRRTGAVRTFEYRPLHNNKRVNLIVTISGWMTGKVDDVRLPFSTVDPVMGDIYSVFWEPDMLQSTGSTINILATEALTQGLQQVLGSTILTALMGALQLPIVLSKLAYLIDNPWNVSLVRANAAGLILADSIMDRNLGKRPITLVGFSLGSRVIFTCLKELANRGAYGLVQNVYLFGSPVVVNKDDYLRARSVVPGRFVNGYSSNDWILGYLFRATAGGIMRVAGLAPIEDIPGVENFNATSLVNGHMSYRAAMPRLLREVGWDVVSDEFAEIEDPDPENHAERQRELIREIDEARKEAEQQPEKKRFGLFKRSKLAQKRGWETYDPEQVERRTEANEHSGAYDNVLFDIDAIRAELASEQIQVKQLESTMPPIKLDLNALPDRQQASSEEPRPEVKQTRSLDERMMPEKSSLQTSPHDLGHTPPGQDNIDMTFDTSYNSSSQSLPNRPPLHSSTTMPVTSNLEHNAWADHEEGEISMTFE